MAPIPHYLGRFGTVLLRAIVFAAALLQAQNDGSASAETSKPLGNSTQNKPDADQSAQDQAQPESMFPPIRDTRFWLSGQANFIFQTHPDFHTPYSGAN